MTEATTHNQTPSNQHTTLPSYPTREQLHRTFGGIIYSSDFETNFTGHTASESFIARRIECDASREMVMNLRKKDIGSWK